MTASYMRVIRLCTCGPFLVTLLTCGARPELEILPPKEPEVDIATPVYLVAKSLPPSSRFIWQCDDGICDPQDTTELATTYQSAHVGINHLVVRAFSDGREIIKQSLSFETKIHTSPHPGPGRRAFETVRPASGGPAVRQPKVEPSAGSSPNIPRFTPRPPVADSQGHIVSIKMVPPYSEDGGPTRTDTISGVVATTHVADYLIVVYARTNTWWVQPLATAPITVPDPKTGEWRCETHLGVQYAVLAVTPDYVAKVRPMIDELPRDGGGVVDVLVIDGRKEPSH